MGLPTNGSKETLGVEEDYKAVAYGIHLPSHYMYVKCVGASVDQFHFTKGRDGQRDRRVRP